MKSFSYSVPYLLHSGHWSVSFLTRVCLMIRNQDVGKSGWPGLTAGVEGCLESENGWHWTHLYLDSEQITADSIRRPPLTVMASFVKRVWSDLKLRDLQSDLASCLIWLCLVSAAAQNSSTNGSIVWAGWGLLSILHHNLPKYFLMDWADGTAFQ